MFKDKGNPMELGGKKTTINMMLAITTQSQAPKTKVFKEKEP
jgi:hypothetical protein